MGGGGIDFPEPTDEERALQQEQIAILRSQQGLVSEQARLQELLAPFLFESAGLIPQLDESGTIIGFEQEEVDTTRQDLLSDLQEQTLRQQLSVLNLTQEQLAAGPTEDPLAAIRQDIERQGLERIQQALAGELPIDPGLERELIEGRSALRNRLRQQLGTGFETSTSGIQALAEFDQRALELQASARRGELTIGQQISLARESSNAARGGQGLNELSQLLGLSQAAGGFGSGVTMGEFGRLFGGTGNISQSNLATAGAFGQTASGFQNPLSNLFAERQGIFQADQFNASQPTLLESIGGLTGTLGGAALGGGIFGG